MIDDMARMISKRTGDPIGILIIASMVRDDFPWLYEIGLEAYRRAKSGNVERAQEALRTFRDAAEATVRGPFMEELGIGSKDAHMMLRDLPTVIDHYMEISLLRRSGKRGALVGAAGSKEGSEHS